MPYATYQQEKLNQLVNFMGFGFSRTQNRRVRVFPCLVVGLAGAFFALKTFGELRHSQSAALPLSPWQSLLPPGASLYPTPTPVIGKLGDLRVTFPRDFVRNVEYDGDPGIGEKSFGQKPKRTHESNIRSLGFDLRFPEMIPTDGTNRRNDQQKFNIRNTPWVRVRLTAGSDFGDGMILERMVANMNSEKGFQYGKLSEKRFGLDVYTPATVDISKRNLDLASGVYRSDLRDRDFFVNRNSSGVIESVIRCSNRNHAAAPCDHRFLLGGTTRTEIIISYRRGMLPHWRAVENATKKLILSFEVK